MNWAQHLKRVDAIDIETCPTRGRKLRVITCIEGPHLIAAILLTLMTLIGGLLMRAAVFI
jgi:hypothetical protein